MTDNTINTSLNAYDQLRAIIDGGQNRERVIQDLNKEVEELKSINQELTAKCSLAEEKLNEYRKDKSAGCGKLKKREDELRMSGIMLEEYKSQIDSLKQMVESLEIECEEKEERIRGMAENEMHMKNRIEELEMKMRDMEELHVMDKKEVNVNAKLELEEICEKYRQRERRLKREIDRMVS
ncbi:unnamed protein product [Sphagnum balticum]